jgi:hypothetical protein
MICPAFKSFVSRTRYYTLQIEGPTALLTEARTGRPTALITDIEGILKQDSKSIKTALEHRGAACRCVDLAEWLNLEREVLLNPNHQYAKARRRQREIEQLLPLLKPDSYFLIFKKKAASHLGAGQQT